MLPADITEGGPKAADRGPSWQTGDPANWVRRRSPPANDTTRYWRWWTDKWVVLRVPFPMSFYAKGLEGHIDNPDAGWKGRGVWTPRGPVSVMRASFERNGRQA
jgi:hypothetical protein